LSFSCTAIYSFFAFRTPPLTTKNKQSSDQLAEKAKEVDHLRNKVNECKVDADQLRNEVKKLNLEKEVNEAKTIRLRNKAKQLSEE
jgi:septal ring factor EnvC (AmiA/AmiB activator)